MNPRGHANRPKISLASATGVGAAPAPRRPAPALPPPRPDRRAWLAAGAFLLLLAWDPRPWDAAGGLWSPPAGLGLALVAWLGVWGAAVLAAAALLAGLVAP